jgi:hypothetical protein
MGGQKDKRYKGKKWQGKFIKRQKDVKMWKKMRLVSAILKKIFSLSSPAACIINIL